MPITVLDDVVFPEDISASACSGKRRRRTDLAALANGQETTNAPWSQSRRMYELGLVARSIADWQRVDALFEVVSGRAYGFLLRDPTDGAVSGAQGGLRPIGPAGEVLGAPGVGFGVPTYRLARLYTVGSRTAAREIFKPESGTVAVSRGGSPVVEGVGAGQIAIDHARGVVTFQPDASSAVSSVTVGGSTQVVLGSALAGLGIGGRLWLDGLAGAGAALLNGLAHDITGLTGSTYTLGTSTAGATITAAGNGRKYPQASEALGCECAYFVAVRFDTDDLDWNLVASGDDLQKLVAGPSIPLVEVLVP